MKNYSPLPTYLAFIIAGFALVLSCFSYQTAKDHKSTLEKLSLLVIDEKNLVECGIGKSKISRLIIKNDEELKSIIEASKLAPNAISYANQTGRLDLVSIAIAMFSVVLGVGAVFGLLHIREGSRLVAKEAIENWIEESASEFLTDEIGKWLEDKGKIALNKQMEEYLNTENENGDTRAEMMIKAFVEFELEKTRAKFEQEKIRKGDGGNDATIDFEG